MTARQQYLINVYATLNSAGRKDQFQRGRYNDPRQGPSATSLAEWNESGPLLGQFPSPTELDELAEQGYITVKSNGAVTITAKGRSARTGSLGCIVP